MTKYFIFFVFILSDGVVNAQISVDSLMQQLSTNYSKTGSKEYLMETFIQFESQDKTDRYDVFLDSVGHVQEYIGLSIVHYTYDSLYRIKLIEGFNSAGLRSYWDFPVLTQFTYVSDTLVFSFQKIRKEMYNESVSNSLSDVVIETTMVNGADLSKKESHVKVSSSDKSSQLSFTIGLNGKVREYQNKVCYIYREFDNTNRLILQERYYDKHLHLINGKHDVYQTQNMSFSPLEKKYAYSIRKVENGSLKEVTFYNKNGKLVGVQHIGSYDGPVNVSE